VCCFEEVAGLPPFMPEKITSVYGGATFSDPMMIDLRIALSIPDFAIS
jgi:hypothetical protein